MKRSALFLVLVGFGIVACGGLETYYRPGVSVSTLNRDTDACKVKALRDVPPSTQVRRYPPEYIPPVKECDADGVCTVVRVGYFIPGEIVTFDPNDALRKRVENQCMADKGYLPVSIPPCPGNVVNTVPARATKTLPDLTPNSCVIRNKNGTFQIVTRG
ncbi:hypothetical protein [Sulfitobacter aestuariivivens]|uniref:Uncharacterized protein n=1 Tax=Sulfitobacter aestuariivivens TaxID=2766981 RepID=A0A927HEB1_9RHOB|nr:hypothetical protein [Sulfitobacter aestuariivivens]MBD3663174.1 hypothetical protein [Sulfitobacter aestuariivivens]